MRIIIMSIILVCNFIVQSAIFPFLHLPWSVPDSLLAIVVSFSLLNGSIAGAIVGFSGGMLQDVMFGKYIGLNALLYMLIGYIVGLPFKKIYMDQFIVPGLIGMASYILKELLMILVLYILRIDVPSPILLFKKIIPGMLYTGIAMVIINFFMIWLHSFNFMNKKRRIGMPLL